MAGRKHLIAVNRTIAGAGLDERGEHAAIVEMARNLARRMDSVGSDDPPMSLVKSFQSALKDLQRAAGSKTPPKPGRDGVEVPKPGRDAVDVGAGLNVLEEYRRRWRSPRSFPDPQTASDEEIAAAYAELGFPAADVRRFVFWLRHPGKDSRAIERD